MKREYIFVILIIVILYLLYLIIDYKYKEYKINNYIDYIQQDNLNLREDINKNKEFLEYINTKAYKNKVLKEELSMKNKWETVIFFTNEDKYKKFATQNEEIISTKKEIIWDQSFLNSMSNYQRWIFFLFNKDVR